MNQKEGKEARPKCDLASSAKFESGIHQMIILGSCYALRFPNFASPGKLRQTSGRLNPRKRLGRGRVSFDGWAEVVCIF